MKSIVVSAALLAVAGMAFAEPACNAPKDKWIPEAQFKKTAEDQGYQIKTFKINKGQCYEIYGVKDGKKVEHFFDPATGARVTQ
ncbi:PepSY domain-containing protein [Hydrogenophaga soli]|nr:PepSY domain-containing protein [Burkholderiaceae bacterium]